MLSAMKQKIIRLNALTGCHLGRWKGLLWGLTLRLQSGERTLTVNRKTTASIAIYIRRTETVNQMRNWACVFWRTNHWPVANWRHARRSYRVIWNHSPGGEGCVNRPVVSELFSCRKSERRYKYGKNLSAFSNHQTSKNMHTSSRLSTETIFLR